MGEDVCITISNCSQLMQTMSSHSVAFIRSIFIHILQRKQLANLCKSGILNSAGVILCEINRTWESRVIDVSKTVL
jgi:uncharacterized membrane protein